MPYTNKEEQPATALDLVEESRQLDRVPAGAAKHYAENQSSMTHRVNELLGRHPDLQYLIGDNPLSMMYDNHRHHAAFMSNVFLFNNFELLAAMLPWVYRSYSNQGFSFDYFKTELNAWKKAVADALPLEEGVEILAVYDWMLARHEQVIALAESPVPLIPVDQSRVEVVEQMTKAVLWGDFQQSLRLGKGAVRGSEDLPGFFSEVVQTVMYEVGRLWEKGDISVAQEHLASATMIRLLSTMYAMIEMPAITKGKAVITAAPNEFHEIGAWLVANSLELDGWDVTYLGSNTPSEDLLDLLKLIQPDILGISVAMPFNLDRVRDIVVAAQKQQTRTLKVMLGGLAVNAFPNVCQELQADACAGNCLEAVEKARSWWGGGK